MKKRGISVNKNGVRLDSLNRKQKRGPNRRISVELSVHRSLFTVFLCELLCVFHEFCAVFSVFLRQVRPQRVLRLRDVHQSDETLNHCGTKHAIG